MSEVQAALDVIAAAMQKFAEGAEEAPFVYIDVDWIDASHVGGHRWIPRVRIDIEHCKRVSLADL